MTRRDLAGRSVIQDDRVDGGGGRVARVRTNLTRQEDEFGEKLLHNSSAFVTTQGLGSQNTVHKQFGAFSILQRKKSLS